MSDTRFIIVGIGLVFAGFLVLGVFGDNYQTSSVEVSEFGNCFEYSESNEPIPINCSDKIFDQTIFFVTVFALIVAGIISLIKGVKGKWDSQIKPEDMVGPGKEEKKE